jgi:hypothetical protein
MKEIQNQIEKIIIVLVNELRRREIKMIQEED